MALSTTGFSFDREPVSQYGSGIMRHDWGRRGVFAVPFRGLGTAGFLLAFGCGGAIGGPDGSGGAGTGGDESAGVGGLRPAASGGAATSTGGSGGRADAAGGTTYVEEPCPDVPSPAPQTECDPLDPGVGCGSGYGCYPYLEYPYGERCGFATFGAVCAPSSTGEQGDLCGTSNYCAPGYMCVIGATGGARCSKLCPLVAPSGCPSGLLCTETDVMGYGVCF